MGVDVTRGAVGAEGRALASAWLERGELAVQAAAAITVGRAGIVEQRAGLAGARARRAAAHAVGALGKPVVTIFAQRHARQQETGARVGERFPLAADLCGERFATRFGARGLVLEGARGHVAGPGRRPAPGRFEEALTLDRGARFDEPTARQVIAPSLVEHAARIGSEEPRIDRLAAIADHRDAAVGLSPIK